MKKLALALLAPALFAGCGLSPQGMFAGSNRNQDAVQAASSQAKSLELRIPSTVMGYVDEHLEKVKAEYAKEYETDMYGRPMYPKYKIAFDKSSRSDLKVVVSRDGFKTRIDEAGMYRYRRFEGKDLLVPFNTAPGEAEYYLELQVSVLSATTDKLVKRLPVTYISNMGQNYKAAL